VIPKAKATEGERIRISRFQAGESQYVQQAQAEARADIKRVEDDRAQELFGRVAAVLDGVLQSLYDFQGGGKGAPLMTR
jgi:hypothetical protein